MLKEAPSTVGRTVVHPNFFRLDGPLLFCIIMGLRSASSALIDGGGSISFKPIAERRK